MRSMSAQARLPLDLMPGRGPVLNVGVRERGQQLGLAAHYETRVLRVVLEVLYASWYTGPMSNMCRSEPSGTPAADA